MRPNDGRADVDVGLWLDLAGAADDRGEILVMNLRGQNFGVARLCLTMKTATRTIATITADTIRRIFFMGAVVLQEAPDLFYAKPSHPVPKCGRIHKTHESLTLALCRNATTSLPWWLVRAGIHAGRPVD